MRLRQLIPLNESSWGGLLYHATYHDFDPKHVKPGTHFGTLHAALHRAHDEEFNDDGDSQYAKLKIHAFKYKPSGKVKQGEDTGTSYFGKQYDDPKTRGKGVSTISYINKSEAPGSVSHIVYDPENLKHVHTFNSPNKLKKYDKEEWKDTFLKPNNRGRGYGAEEL